MRDYNKENKKINWIGLSIGYIIISIVIFLLLLSFSTLIAKTNISTASITLFSIVTTFACSVFSAYIILRYIRIKPIFCAIISSIILVVLKLGLNYLIFKTISISGKGIISIIFIILFSLLSTIIFANAKK